MRLQRRIGKLRALAAVQLTSPQRVLGVTYVGEPLPVARKVQFAGGDAIQLRQKMTRILIVALQFEAQLLPDYE